MKIVKYYNILMTLMTLMTPGQLRQQLMDTYYLIECCLGYREKHSY